MIKRGMILTNYRLFKQKNGLFKFINKSVKLTTEEEG